MNYKDKVLIPILVLAYLIPNRVLFVILILTACFISLEYPLKYRGKYLPGVLMCSVFVSGVMELINFFEPTLDNISRTSFTNTNFIESILQMDFTYIVIELAFYLTLYYRDNEDFVYREKIKKYLKKKEPDTATEEQIQENHS